MILFLWQKQMTPFPKQYISISNSAMDSALERLLIMQMTILKLSTPSMLPSAPGAWSFSGLAPVYTLSPRGSCLLQGDKYSVDTGQGTPTEAALEEYRLEFTEADLA